MLRKLLVKQSLLMALLNIERNSENLKSAAIGMAVEASEVLDLLNKASRTWKHGSADASDDVIEETIDVLFYLLETLMISGVTTEAEIVRRYNLKFAYNLTRIFESKFPTFGERQHAMRNWAAGLSADTLATALLNELRNMDYIVGSPEGFTDDEISFLARPTVQMRRWQNDDRNDK